MVAQVAMAEMMLALAVVMVLVGLVVAAIVRTLTTSPSLVVNRRVVLLHSDAEDDGFLKVLASYLQRHGCQIHEPEVRRLRFDAINLFAELPPGIDCVIAVRVEAILGQRLDVQQRIDTACGWAYDSLPIPVEMPVIDYTVSIGMRNLQGEFFGRTLHLFRWVVSPGNAAADAVGETIIAVLAGVATPTTAAGSREEVMVR